MSSKIVLVAFAVIALAVVSAKRSEKYYARGHVKRIPCGSNEFACKDGNACIPIKWTCDIEQDCDDGSDEGLTCPTDCSHANQFSCKNKQCISRDFVCDGSNDCGDSSDETDCEHFQCIEGEIKCDNFLCIEEAWKCDGYDDCLNNWDEKNCPSG
ncbi:unnamed protein product [Lymnaea stagnalis]|uniref:Uncharacterized protein n=1 Tax=Lymnaea stagnalis TaxID=6523 RepID=A0AAV2H493_LYMST